ncbi:MAG: TetR/AcrR family transcriptional regulator [Aestuariivirga sp.]
MSRPSEKPAGTRVSREDWLHTALDTLVSDGVENVKVLVLAQKLNVSRSSFYWFFKSRQDLLDQLLNHWRDTNTRVIAERAALRSASIVQSTLNLFACWIDESLFDPRLDFAVREWARRSGHVRRAVDQADDARVDAIKSMFVRFGFREKDAFIRARVLYFMQIGYYSLDLEEPLDTRLSYVTEYLRVFTGQDIEARDISWFIKEFGKR